MNKSLRAVERESDVTSFQKSFIPSYKNLFKAMMCDVLASLEQKDAYHFVIRRPHWQGGTKTFEYAYIRLPHDCEVGSKAYKTMLDSEDFWEKCHSIFLRLKNLMFTRLNSKRAVIDSLQDHYYRLEASEQFKGDFYPKALDALDRK